jgi:glucose-1-phosphate adenylyltransferase
MPGSTKNILGMILAVGEGNTLYPLTEHRAKPTVPFGGKYRLIDSALSNFINSSVYSVYVLTQCKSQSLTEHINESWSFGSLIHNHFIVKIDKDCKIKCPLSTKVLRFPPTQKLVII